MILDFCSTSRDYCTAVCVASWRKTIRQYHRQSWATISRRNLQTYLVEGRFNFKKVSRKVSIDFIANAVCRGNSRDFV